MSRYVCTNIAGNAKIPTQIAPPAAPNPKPNGRAIRRFKIKKSKQLPFEQYEATIWKLYTVTPRIQKKMMMGVNRIRPTFNNMLKHLP
jgi:hypothetical protein